VSENVEGTTFYVDYDRIRKHDGYVYFWRLIDYLKLKEYGVLSVKTYFQGDCKLFRFKCLSYSGHTQPMGGGTGDSFSSKNPECEYPVPDSVGEGVLKFVCSR
jgi:hypothetical protein